MIGFISNSPYITQSINKNGMKIDDRIKAAEKVVLGLKEKTMLLHSYI